MSYSISLTFTNIDSKNPLEATKQIVKWIKDGVDEMVFDVTDEETSKTFTVDLSEEDEDIIVLPND